MYRFVRVGDEPEEKSNKRNMEQYEGATRGFVGHVAKNVEDAPFALMHGVEFVRKEYRKREIEDKVENKFRYLVSRVC